MSIPPEELITITKRVLKLLGVTSYTDLQLTYVLKDEDTWKVSFSYLPFLSIARKVGCFRVDAETREIVGMWLDRTWK